MEAVAGNGEPRGAGGGRFVIEERGRPARPVDEDPSRLARQMDHFLGNDEDRFVVLPRTAFRQLRGDPDVGPVNGGRPVSIWYAVAPRE